MEVGFRPKAAIAAIHPKRRAVQKTERELCLEIDAPAERAFERGFEALSVLIGGDIRRRNGRCQQ